MTSDRGKQDDGDASAPTAPATGGDQRRDHVRVGVRRPVGVIRPDEQAPIRTYSVDLSGNGLLMAGPDTLEIGSRVDLQIALTPRGTRIVASGTVVRITEDGHRAVTFDAIRDGEQRRLVRFLFRLQRLAMRDRHRENHDGQ